MHLFQQNKLCFRHNNTDTYKTFIPVHKTNNQIISSHTTFSRKKYNLGVDEESENFPNFYWTPKLQKNPTKFRFVIVAPQCFLKPL